MGMPGIGGASGTATVAPKGKGEMPPGVGTPPPAGIGGASGDGGKSSGPAQDAKQGATGGATGGGPEGAVAGASMLEALRGILSSLQQLIEKLAQMLQGGATGGGPVQQGGCPHQGGGDIPLPPGGTDQTGTGGAGGTDQIPPDILAPSTPVEPAKPTEDPKPPADDPKPPADDPKPPANDPKPPANDPKPPADDPKPPADDPKPPATDPKPPAEPPKPPAPAPAVYSSQWVRDHLKVSNTPIAIVNFSLPGRFGSSAYFKRPEGISPGHPKSLTQKVSVMDEAGKKHTVWVTVQFGVVPKHGPTTSITKVSLTPPGGGGGGRPPLVM